MSYEEAYTKAEKQAKEERKTMAVVQKGHSDLYAVITFPQTLDKGDVIWRFFHPSEGM